MCQAQFAEEPFLGCQYPLNAELGRFGIGGLAGFFALVSLSLPQNFWRTRLVLIVVAVDAIMGPLLTFTVFNRSKPFGELRRYLAMIGLLQLTALVYGLWTVSIVRPVHLAFEIDRFRVVHAIDIPKDEITKAPPELQRLPWTGPTLLSVRELTNEKEGFEATMATLNGLSLGARPELWQSYEKAKPQN